MQDTLAITKALSDGNRLRVLMTLTHHNELCVCQIIELLALAPATVSRHMSVMQNARLVESRKKGKWVYYRLPDRLPHGLLDWLQRDLVDSTQIKADVAQMNEIPDPDTLCRNRKNARAACCE